MRALALFSLSVIAFASAFNDFVAPGDRQVTFGSVPTGSDSLLGGSAPSPAPRTCSAADSQSIIDRDPRYWGKKSQMTVDGQIYTTSDCCYGKGVDRITVNTASVTCSPDKFSECAPSFEEQLQNNITRADSIDRSKKMATTSAKFVVNTATGGVPLVGAMTNAVVGSFFPDTPEKCDQVCMWNSMQEFVQDYVAQQFEIYKINECITTLDSAWTKINDIKFLMLAAAAPSCSSTDEVSPDEVCCDNVCELTDDLEPDKMQFKYPEKCCIPQNPKGEAIHQAQNSLKDYMEQKSGSFINANAPLQQTLAMFVDYASLDIANSLSLYFSGGEMYHNPGALSALIVKIENYAYSAYTGMQKASQQRLDKVTPPETQGSTCYGISPLMKTIAQTSKITDSSQQPNPDNGGDNAPQCKWEAEVQTGLCKLYTWSSSSATAYNDCPDLKRQAYDCYVSRYDWVQKQLLDLWNVQTYQPIVDWMNNYVVPLLGLCEQDDNCESTYTSSRRKEFRYMCTPEGCGDNIPPNPRLWSQ